MATVPLPAHGPKAGLNGYITTTFLGVPCVIMGRNSGLATSPLHTQGPNARQNGYITPTFSGAQRCTKWLHHPCLLGAPNTWHGEKGSNGWFILAMWWDKGGQNGKITPAFS